MSITDVMILIAAEIVAVVAYLLSRWTPHRPPDESHMDGGFIDVSGIADTLSSIRANPIAGRASRASSTHAHQDRLTSARRAIQQRSYFCAAHPHVSEGGEPDPQHL